MSDRWKIVRLGECCEIVSGSTPSRAVPDFWNGDIPWVTPKDLSLRDEAILEKPREYITQAGYRSCSTRLLPKGAVLFSSRAPIGLVAIAGVELCTNQGFKSFVPGADVDSRYLYHYLKTMAPRIADLGSGATFKEISRDRIRAVEMPLPLLAEQKCIAAILDKADALRKKRKQSLKLLDAFIRSVFLDMFGDPVVNPKGWEVKRLEEVCTKITDGTHDTPRRLTEGTKFITGKHIRPFAIDYDNSDYVTEDEHREIYRRCNPEFGDILYTNIGVNVGTAAMNNVNYQFSMKNVALLKPNKALIIPRYIEHVLNNNNMKRKIIRVASLGGAQSFLSLNDIKQIEIPMPPIHLQNSFETIVEQMFKCEERMNSCFQELDNQFNSLVQRAFRGEL